jgi:hypothetical protein
VSIGNASALEPLRDPLFVLDWSCRLRLIQAPDRSETCSRRWTGGITRDGLLTKYQRS